MSISEKQLLANRKNAQRSTGPKSASGKLAASKNSLTHGLRSQQIVIEGESQEEFNDFRNLLITRYSPDDPIEGLLVDCIAAGFWRFRRVGHIEAQIFDQMRDSLSNERTINHADFFADTHINDGIGFPSRSRFETFQEAKSAWDATEDGIAFAAGGVADDRSDLDSFSRFLKDSRSPDPDVPESQPVNIVDAISDMKKKYEDKPDMFSRLSELEDTFKIIAQHSRRVHIPSLRLYLQDLRQLTDTSPSFKEKYAADLDDAINDLLSLEMTIKQQHRANLGQALSYDLKGSDVLTKFMRYESQIQRSLFKTMHELQRLQSMRHIRNLPADCSQLTADSRTLIAAPMAIDVDISSDFTP